MKKTNMLFLLIAIVQSLTGCDSNTIESIDLSNIKIEGHTIKNGKNDIYEYSITKDDIESTFGKNYSDKYYDYSQGLRQMIFHDDNNGIVMTVVYLNTADGNIVDWIDVTYK